MSWMPKLTYVGYAIFAGSLTLTFLVYNQIDLPYLYELSIWWPQSFLSSAVGNSVIKLTWVITTAVLLVVSLLTHLVALWYEPSRLKRVAAEESLKLYDQLIQVIPQLITTTSEAKKSAILDGTLQQIQRTQQEINDNYNDQRLKHLQERRKKLEALYRKKKEEVKVFKRNMGIILNQLNPTFALAQEIRSDARTLKHYTLLLQETETVIGGVQIFTRNLEQARVKVRALNKVKDDPFDLGKPLKAIIQELESDLKAVKTEDLLDPLFKLEAISRQVEGLREEILKPQAGENLTLAPLASRQL